MMTNELLHRYAVDGSEPAFTELVRQHIDLVYSAALRQVNGDASAAQDITQEVFTDLARKASKLAGHTSLTGWLYTSARFQAAKAQRAELRRQTRERSSLAMNEFLQRPDMPAAWLELRPVLDDVMHELNEADREAVLLRYFERKPMAEIGARLGLSENAARMRVDRALEKLRAKLSKRGITSTAAALAPMLTERAVGAAPATLVAKVSKSALDAAAVGGGLAFGLLKFAGPTFKWLAGAAAIAGIGWVVWNPQAQPNNTRPELSVTNQLAETPAATQPAPPTADPPASAVVPPETTNRITLRIVTADTGQPIPGVEIDCFVWGAGESEANTTLHADHIGSCDVPLPRATVTKLILVSTKDGFAETRLQWHTDQGEKIPAEYTLRLPRATPIGGYVLDADGNPVPGARIVFHSRPDMAHDVLNETSVFAYGFFMITTTDLTGHWEIYRIAKEAIPFVSVLADHPDHLLARLQLEHDRKAQEQLIAGSYTFHLGRPATIQGVVTDAAGTAISGATVEMGYAGFFDARQTKTSRNGTFFLGGCKPESTPLSASASGFATTTLWVDPSTNQGQFHLTLTPGRVLRLRVVDAGANPIPQALVHYDNSPRYLGRQDEARAVQASFSRKTDADGRVEWEHAPEGGLRFIISVGDRRTEDVQVKPDDQEQVITFNGPSVSLTLFGSVTDAETGRLLPSFRLISGWPVTDAHTGEVEARWSDWDWLKFDGGTYRYAFTEPPLNADPKTGFIFKFEAEGYASVVTRAFTGQEGETQLDVALRPAAPITMTALLPNGQPAAQADVGLVRPHSWLKLCPGGLSYEGGRPLYSTDDAGRLSWNLDESVKRTVEKVVIAHREGFAQVSATALFSNTTVQLQPWSRVEGTLLYKGQPAPGRALFLNLRSGDFESLLSDPKVFQTTTDDAGRFIFSQAPPAENELHLIFPLGANGFSFSPLTNFDLPPGETVTVAVTASTLDPPTPNQDGKPPHPSSQTAKP